MPKFRVMRNQGPKSTIRKRSGAKNEYLQLLCMYFLKAPESRYLKFVMQPVRYSLRYPQL